MVYKKGYALSDLGGPLPQHSPFTGHLLQALQGNAQSDDGILTANGVINYVYEKVAKDGRARQTPHYAFLDGDGDFIFRAEPLESLSDNPETDKDILVAVPPVSGTLNESEVDFNLATPFQTLNFTCYSTKF